MSVTLDDLNATFIAFSAMAEKAGLLANAVHGPFQWCQHKGNWGLYVDSTKTPITSASVALRILAAKNLDHILSSMIAVQETRELDVETAYKEVTAVIERLHSFLKDTR